MPELQREAALAEERLLGWDSPAKRGCLGRGKAFGLGFPRPQTGARISVEKIVLRETRKNSRKLGGGLSASSVKKNRLLKKGRFGGKEGSGQNRPDFTGEK